jgi:DNA polymerase-1
MQMTKQSDTRMDVLEHPKRIEAYLEQIPDDILVAVTAPLKTRDHVIICIYNDALGDVAIHVVKSLAEQVYKIVYEPKRRPIAVHGIKTIWHDLQIVAPTSHAAPIICTKILAYLLHPEWKEHRYFLGHLSEHYLKTRYPYTPSSVYRAEYPNAFYDILSHDARLIHSLAAVLEEHMDDALRSLYRDVELPVAAILNEMSLSKGLRVDWDACRSEWERAKKEQRDLEKLIFGDGDAMELRTSQQAYQYLSQKIPINDKHSRDTKQISGFVLDELACDHEEAVWVSRWRELDAGIWFLRAALNPDNEGRIRSTWKQTLAKTGRIIARESPVQNIKREYRNLLLPDEGHVLIKADYSQSQLRILAHLSQDEELLKAYEEDLDLHFDTGKRHRRVGEGEDLDEATRKSIRNLGKDINFSICFGSTAKGLAGTINKKCQNKDDRISVETAKTYVQDWENRFPQVRPFFKERWKTLESSDENTRIERSPLGRKRVFLGDNPAIRRQHRAQVLQSFEADMLKQAMVRIDGHFKKNLFKSRIVMAIHDSLWVHAPLDEMESVREMVRREMTRAIRMSVPAVVDVEIVPRKPLKYGVTTDIFPQNGDE